MSRIQDPEDIPLLDGLQNLAINQVTLRRIFYILTRVHYSDPNNYGDMKALLGNYVWHKDIAKRTLHIDFDYNYDPKNTDLRPVIYVGCDDIIFERSVSNNQAGQTEDLSGDRYVKQAQTGVILRHIGSSPDEAGMLGDMSMQFFLGLRNIMLDRRILTQYEVVTLKTPKPFAKPADAASPEFVVDLVLKIGFNSSWLVVTESHRIKTIGFRQSQTDV